MNANEDIITQDELIQEYWNNFNVTATLQGRVAYALMSIHAVNPWIFSRVLGSLMFNHSTMLIYQWVLRIVPEHRPYSLTFLGFLCGRLLTVYILAYLYHVDTRSIIGVRLRRNTNYETMYS
ncbi:hypothetical protein FQA39_LY17870 [Lamprigera yunnana]|nr:hypothetical protein FQA39_LY17870 [Lamprigera yunnana]